MMCYGTHGNADDGDDTLPSVHHEEPVGVTITHQGTEYQCFNTEDWRQVGRIILDYHSLWFQAHQLQRELRLAEDRKVLWEERVALWRETAEEQRQDRKYLKTVLDAEHDYRLNLSKESRAKSWVMWAVIVVESVALGALGVAHLSRGTQ